MLCSTNILAQSIEATFVPTSEVPAVVSENQKNLFSEVYVESWSSSGVSPLNPNIFTAHYREKGRDGFSATYTKDGLLLYTMKFLEKNNLPETVVIKVRNEYDKFVIQNGYIITLIEPKRTIYRISLLDNTRLRYAYYTINGLKIPMSSLPEELKLLGI